MKYLIPILMIVVIAAFKWDQYFTKLRLEKCAEQKTNMVMVYGKARSCPQGSSND